MGAPDSGLNEQGACLAGRAVYLAFVTHVYSFFGSGIVFFLHVWSGLRIEYHKTGIKASPIQWITRALRSLLHYNLCVR